MDDLYKQRLLKLIDKIEIDKIVEEVVWMQKRGHRLFVAGNGGSASLASHFAQDLNKVAGVRAISLTDSISLITALANDLGFSSIFKKQLYYKNAKKGDLFFIFSCSGASPNLVEAAYYCQGLGVDIISLVGTNGGRIKDLSKVCLHFDDQNYGLVESVFSITSHYLTREICYRLLNQSSSLI